MSINSKQKGKRIEREFAHFLNDTFGFNCRRGQQFRGGNESPDVVGVEGIHFEVKGDEHLNVHKAMLQAVGECGSNIPVVAHKKNRTEWLLTIRAKDLHAFSNVLVDRAMHLRVPLVPEKHRETLLQGNGAND